MAIFDIRDSDLRIVNNVLLMVLVTLAGYIMFIPFLPEVEVAYNAQFDKTKGYRYQSRLAAQMVSRGEISTFELQPIPAVNTLVIPQIGVDSPILEGDSPNVLNDGLWRRPHTSDPVTGGNMVITGHRFMYTTGPKTFYHLDRLKVGDKFFVFWEGKEYDYQVYDRYVVSPDSTQIEDQTDRDILTLYTCHPLWSAKERLVVRAKLMTAP